MQRVQRPRLILISGLPAAGKTTSARLVEHGVPAVRLAPDEWMTSLGIHGKDNEARERIERLQWELARRLLRLGQSVVLEYGFWGRAERDRIRQWARDNDLAVELRFLDVSEDELRRRVAARNPTLDDSTMAIEPHEIERWSSWFEPPDADELELFDQPLDT